MFMPCVWPEVFSLVHGVDPLIVETGDNSKSFGVVPELCLNVNYLAFDLSFIWFFVMFVCLKRPAEANLVRNSAFLFGFIVQLGFQLLFVDLGSVVS